MDIKQLELAGLTKYEALAFEAITRLGKAGASEISQESGVPYGRVYDVLNSLISHGMIRLIPEKAKRYTISSSDTLKMLISGKKAQLDALGEELDKLKPVYEGQDAVFIAKGKRNFYKIMRQIPYAKTYAYSFKYTSEFNSEWVRDTKISISKGVDIKSLVRCDKETLEAIQDWKHKVPELKMRKFENSGVAMEVLDDEIVWFSLIKSNTMVVIKDKPFASIIKKMFVNSWKASSDV